MNIFAFVRKSLFRHKLRVTLTIFSLTTAFVLFILLRSVAVVFEAGWSGLDESRMQTTSKYSMIQMLPLSYGTQIATTDGVNAVTHASWFGGSFVEGDTNVATFAVDPDTYFQVYNDYGVAPDQLEKFQSMRTAALAPASLVERYGWEIGQQIPCISTIFPQSNDEPWTFELVGTYTGPNSNTDGFLAFLFNYKYLHETYDLGSVGWYVFSINDPKRSTEIAQAVDSKFANSFDETSTMTESEGAREFMSQWGDVSLMVTGILSAVFFTMVLLTMNTMIQSYRERIPELAVLKTIGFSNTKVACFMICEGLLLSGVSAFLGIAFGVVVTSGAQEMFGNMVFMYLELNTIIWGAIIAIVLGLFVGIIPAVGANRLRIVDALHAR